MLCNGAKLFRAFLCLVAQRKGMVIMMNNRKYPIGLFITGFITNILFHFFWLSIPCLILLIVGIFVKPCLYIGLAVLLLDIVLSLIEQIRIRKAFLAESDNPDFKEFQDALSKDGDWRENMGEFLNQKIFHSAQEISLDDDPEDPQATEGPQATEDPQAAEAPKDE